MKKTVLIVFVIMFVFICEVMAQAPGDIIWTRTYGGNSIERGFRVKQTTDGGFIMVGITESYGAGNEDVWLVKTDGNGIEEWNQTYGGLDGEWAYSVQQTADGGFIIGGFTESYGAGGWVDYWLVKTDENGIEEWNQTYGGTGADSGISVQQTIDGGYIFVGYTDSYGSGLLDCWLVKTDEDGIEEWNQTYGGIGNEYTVSVQQTTDNGFIITGCTESYGAGTYDCWLIKTDESGIEEWNQTYGGNNYDYGSSVQQTADGGFIIAGYTESYGAGLLDYWVIKTDEYGIEEWNQTYGGNGYDSAHSIQPTTDGGYIIVGYSESYGAGDYDFYLIKIAGDSYQPLNPPQNLFVTETGYATWEEPISGGPQTIQVDPLSVPYWTGSCTYTAWTEDSEVKGRDFEDGWMMFDISEIPVGATITEIEFHGFVNDNIWPYWQINGVYLDPLTANVGDFKADIEDDEYNYLQESGDLPIDWRVEILGGTANADFEAALAQEWFCIGINSTDNSNTYYIEFDGWNEANPPYLVVTYESAESKKGNDIITTNIENRDLLGYNVYLDWGFIEYTTDLFYQYTNLINGQSYLSGVSAVYNEGQSEIVEFEFTPVLDPPQNLDVACIEDHAHFTWEAPTIDARFSKNKTISDKENTRDLTGYNVYLDQEEVATNIPDLEYDFYDLINGEFYNAGVKAIYNEGTSELVEINFEYTGTGVENILPLITKLTGNYPNPFNPITTISFSITESIGNTELMIYNLKGQKVKTLIYEKLPAGNHQVVWDGKDENSKPVSSGIYFYKMNTGNYTSTKKMILMK